MAREGVGRDEISKESEMIALVKLAKLAFIALAVLLRWMVGKLDQHGNRTWVTGRTGNVTVVTDRIL